MPYAFTHAESLAYLQQFLTHNKARGMMAELAFDEYLARTAPHEALKIYDGAWLVAPNVARYDQRRHAIFVLPQLYASEAELQTAWQVKERDRGFQTLALYLAQGGMRVVVTGAYAKEANLQQLNWRQAMYQRERLLPLPEHEPFASWPGRGRASPGGTWQADVVARFHAFPVSALTGLTLQQAFYYGYLKRLLHKSLADPYDVDGFLVGYGGQVLPLEIKEKSATAKGSFGLDVGRILMMLRLGLCTGQNGLYLIREVDSSPERAFLRWRCITLADLIMGCSWNLQGGGKGMGGGDTQTVMMAGSLFQDFEPRLLCEEWLMANASLQHVVQRRATEMFAMHDPTNR